MFYKEKVSMVNYNLTRVVFRVKIIKKNVFSWESVSKKRNQIQKHVMLNKNNDTPLEVCVNADDQSLKIYANPILLLFYLSSLVYGKDVLSRTPSGFQ